MQHAGVVIAIAAQAAFDIQQAAQVAADDGTGAGLARYAGICCRPCASTVRRYLTENVPPKPQQVVDSTISFSFTPGIFASSARGCL